MVDTESMQNDEAEKAAEIEHINNNLVGWADIYNGLRGNDQFGARARFLWMQTLDPLYHQLPEGSKFDIEVTASKGEELKGQYPNNVLKTVDEKNNIRYYLQADTHKGGWTPAAPGTSRLELNLTENEGTGLRLGLNSINDRGVASTRDAAMQLLDVVGFKVEPPPSK